MGALDYGLENVLGAPYRGGGAVFAAANPVEPPALLVAAGGRVVTHGLTRSRTRVLPWELTHNITALAVSAPGAAAAAAGSIGGEGGGGDDGDDDDDDRRARRRRRRARHMAAAARNPPLLAAADAAGLVAVAPLHSGGAGSGAIANRVRVAAVVPHGGLAWSPDGRSLAIAVGRGVEVWRLPRHPALPSFAALVKVAVYVHHDAEVVALGWSPNGRRLASGSADHTVRVYTLPRRGGIASGVDAVDSGDGGDAAGGNGVAASGGGEGGGGHVGTAPAPRVRPVVLLGHRDAVVMVQFVGARGLVSLSRDGLLQCWRLRANDDAWAAAARDRRKGRGPAAKRRQPRRAAASAAAKATGGKRNAATASGTSRKRARPEAGGWGVDRRGDDAGEGGTGGPDGAAGGDDDRDRNGSASSTSQSDSDSDSGSGSSSGSDSGSSNNDVDAASDGDAPSPTAASPPSPPSPFPPPPKWLGARPPPPAATATQPLKSAWVVPLSARLHSRHFVKQAGGRGVASAALHAPSGLLVIGQTNGVLAVYELPRDMHPTTEDAGRDAALFAGHTKDAAGVALRERLRVPIRPDDGDHDAAAGALRLQHALSVAAGSISAADVSADGEWVALASAAAGQLLVWEWRSESHILKRQSHLLPPSAATYSPDGRLLGTASEDGRVKLWDAATGVAVATFYDPATASPVSALHFSARDVLLSASADGAVRAYDVRRYRCFRTLVGPRPARQLGAVAADASGDVVAAGCCSSFEVLVWSLRTGALLDTLDGHTGAVSAVAFRPGHGGVIASGSWDGTVRVVDLYARGSGAGAVDVLRHSKEVLAIAYRPDGRELAVATRDGDVTLWNAGAASIVGTIDGRRDVAGGRLRAARTVAPQTGFFRSVAYTADGRFLLAGGSSAYLVVYHAEAGSALRRVERLATTQNVDTDGVVRQLNSGLLPAAGGEPLDLIDMADDEHDADGTVRMSRRDHLPGVTVGAAADARSRRSRTITAQVVCVVASPVAATFAAVTHEGVLTYTRGAADVAAIHDADGGSGGSVGRSGAGDAADALLFDPSDLGEDVTAAAVRRASARGDAVSALSLALRLGDAAVTNTALSAVPPAEVPSVVGGLPRGAALGLARALAGRLRSGSVHLEFDLSVAAALLGAHGRALATRGAAGGTVDAALRALQRAVAAHWERLSGVCEDNTHALAYLRAAAAREGGGVRGGCGGGR